MFDKCEKSEDFFKENESNIEDSLGGSDELHDLKRQSW